MLGALYFGVILLACVFGAIVGLGGGIFIRPIFDSLGFHDMANIQFFSSSAILSMAVVSTYKKIKDGSEIDKKKASLISLGSIIGGILGDLILRQIMTRAESDSRAQIIQAISTVIVLGLSLLLTSKSYFRYEIKNKSYVFIFGIFLGTIAVFLGIGGGPMNVPIFMIFFGLSIKDAAAYSIVVIFFSHLSRIITIGFTTGYAVFDLQILIFVIPAALLGGFAGARFSKILSDNTVKKLFVAAISAVIILNIYNALFVF